MFVHRSTYKQVISWFLFFILALGLSMLSEILSFDRSFDS